MSGEMDWGMVRPGDAVIAQSPVGLLRGEVLAFWEDGFAGQMVRIDDPREVEEWPVRGLRLLALAQKPAGPDAEMKRRGEIAYLRKKAVGDQQRARILTWLRTAKGLRGRQEIAQVAGISVTAAIYHLDKLVESGEVQRVWGKFEAITRKEAAVSA